VPASLYYAGWLSLASGCSLEAGTRTCLEMRKSVQWA